MPEDRDPALDPTPERGDRLFPPGAPRDAAGGSRRDPPDGDDDRLFPPVAGTSGSSPGPADEGTDRLGGHGHDDEHASGADDGSGEAAGSDGEDAPDGDARVGEGSPDADGRSGQDDVAAADAFSGTEAASGKPARRRAKGANSFLRELPVLLLIAFVLAFVLRTFVVQVFYIPSGSMEPTLQVDDRMVVEKVTYLFREPARGEVAVFEGESFGEMDPDATAGERFVRGVGQFLGLVPASARDFVKRVIGLPGDEILIEGGTVFVNGDPLDEPYVVFEDPSDFGPITVPDGQLFFLGDNRPNSSDSRRSLGYVPLDQVVGRAAYVIWPPDNTASLMGTEYLDVDGPR